MLWYLVLSIFVLQMADDAVMHAFNGMFSHHSETFEVLNDQSMTFNLALSFYFMPWIAWYLFIPIIISI